MILNLTYPIDTDHIIFSEINNHETPGETFLVFTDNNGTYIDFDFDYKFIRADEDDLQFAVYDHYQLFVTEIRKIKHYDSDFTFSINKSQSEKLIEFINSSFKEKLQFDDDNIFLN